VKKVETLVPSFKGDIISVWEKKGTEINLSLKIPKGMEAEIISRGKKLKSVKGPGKFNFVLES